MRHYIAILHKNNHSDYGVSFPDFPGCITAGRTLEEAKNLANEVLPFHIEGLQADGDVVPEPMDLDQALKHEFAKGAEAFFIVEVPFDDQIVRANITIPKGLLSRIDRYAKSHHLSRSAFLSQAAQNAMR